MLPLVSPIPDFCFRGFWLGSYSFLPFLGWERGVVGFHSDPRAVLLDDGVLRLSAGILCIAITHIRVRQAEVS